MTDPVIVDPAALEAEAARRAEKMARRAHRRRNALRWSAALVVSLVVGGGTAFAISLPQRTDLPGLATPPDGRYDFPKLTLPALPAGQAAPSTSANSFAQQHLADIRPLLLPRPVGATARPVAGTKDGWLADPSSLFVVRDSKSIFAEFGLRHTAAESFKTNDGATTSVYLLQFIDDKAAASAHSALANAQVTADDEAALSSALTGVPTDVVSQDLDVLANGVVGAYAQVTADGKITRYGTFVSGDIVTVVVQSGPARLGFAPFRQVMTLQAELLQ